MKNKIAIVGAGQFGTALSHSLALNENNNIRLFSTSIIKVEEINLFNRNSSVFPNKIINNNISATIDFKELSAFKFIFLAIPSFLVKEFIDKNKKFITNETIIINLSKGLISSKETIHDFLEKSLPNCFNATMKGPSFAVELLNGADTLFTFASNHLYCFKEIRLLSDGTNLFFDFTKDVKSVEYLSVIKNIYAILIGFIDAKHNSANTRFFILTKAFNEIIFLLNVFDCQKDSINLSCGFGDLCLTSLNDLSRNRTFGLLMGKGFYHPKENNVVVEGKKAAVMISQSINEELAYKLPLFFGVIKSFDTGKIDINFKDFIIQNEIDDNY